MLPGEREQAAEILRISAVDVKTCIQCGKCSACCPASGHMDVLPHQVVGYLRNGQAQPVKNSKTLWKCASCFACAERCPKSVDPARLIEAARLSVIRKQGENRLKADDITALLDDKLPQQAIVSAFRKYSK